MRLTPLILTAMALAAPAAVPGVQAAMPLTGGTGDQPSAAVGSDGSGHVTWRTAGNNGQVDRRGDVVDPQILDGTQQRRLAAARDRWRADRVRNYRFRISLSCYCPDSRAPTVIVVRRGRPRDAPAHLRQAATVPRLLRLVQHAIDERVSGLSVRYGSRGIPRSISIDSSRVIADDERAYAVDRFRAARTAAAEPPNVFQETVACRASR